MVPHKENIQIIPIRAPYGWRIVRIRPTTSVFDRMNIRIKIRKETVHNVVRIIPGLMGDGPKNLGALTTTSVKTKVITTQMTMASI